MPTKSELGARLPVRRGFGAEDAATYLSLSPSYFRQLVGESKMPRPRIIGSRRVWDIDDLDAMFKALPREGGGEDESASDSMADWQ